MERDVAGGGTGGPLGFLVLADKGSHVATLCGLKRSAHNTNMKAIFILDQLRLVRYRSYTAEHLVLSTEELMRNMLAVQQLDQQSQGQRLLAPAGWLPGGQLIDCSTPAGRQAYCRQLAKTEKYRVNNNRTGSANSSKDKHEDMQTCTKNGAGSNSCSDGVCVQKAVPVPVASHTGSQKATSGTPATSTPAQPSALESKPGLNDSTVKAAGNINKKI
jgi:hypothetical protein